MISTIQNFIRDLPIRRKLLFGIVATCMVALAIACAALFWFQSVTFRKAFAAELESLGSIIAHNSAAPLTFDDRKSAIEVLAALKVKPHITSVAVFDREGNLFASLGTQNPDQQNSSKRAVSGVIFKDGYASLGLPIRLDDSRAGRLELRARYTDQYRELVSLYAAVLSTVLAGALAIIFLMSSAIQRVITGPILTLAEVARNVREKEDFSTRAPETSNDEVGQLTRTFNQMLDQIQSRDQRLQESQQRFEVAVQGSSDGIWDWDLITNAMYFSPRWKSILGYANDELANSLEVFQGLLHPEDVDMVMKRVRSYLDGRENVYEVKFRMRHKHGDYLWILSRGVALRDELGKAFRFAGSHTDITESKLAEDRERERAERAVLHQIILLELSQSRAEEWEKEIRRILPAVARFFDVDRVSYWRLTDEKQALVRQELFLLDGEVFDSEQVRLRAADYSSYFSALSRASHPLVFNDALRDPMLKDFEPGHLTPLGITSVMDAPVRLNGQVAGVIRCEHIGMARKWTTDETEFARSAAQHVALALQSHERRKAEAHLRQSELRYRSVVESVRDVIFQTNPAGEWVFLNTAWTDITGHYLEDCLGRAYTDFVHPEDQQRCLELMQPLLEQRQEDCRGEVRFLTTSGDVRWIEIQAQVTYDGTQMVGGISGTLTDISARKTAEVEMARLNRELVDTSRQAGMAEVATGVLHNVGNVLNSVNVSAALVVEQLRKSKTPSLAKVVEALRQHKDDVGEFITRDPKGKQLPAFLDALSQQLAREQALLTRETQGLQKNIEHIKQIVAMQQSFAKVSGVTENLALHELVEDAVRMSATSLLRHQIEIVREFESVPPVLVDRHKILQILVNLFSNAKQALDQRAEGRRLLLRIAPGEGECVRVEVTDNGMGIAKENLTRIFNHGFTTKKTGHGFGLHSGANAAKEMGGSLNVRSDGQGTGATFILELPLSMNASKRSSPSADDSQKRGNRAA